jgi:capsular exopolysaccharide synthesis family protein
VKITPIPSPPLLAAAGPGGLHSAGEGRSTEGSITPLVVEYLHILKRRKWWIAGVIGSALLLAMVVTLFMRPVYTATTQVEVSRDQKNVTNVQGVDSGQSGRDLEFYQTQYSLLEARSLAERVVRRLRLDTTENFWNAHGVDPSAFDTGQPAQRRASEGGSPRQRVAVDLLLENASISPIRGSSLVDINYSSYDPEISARIANTWAAEFIAQSISRKFDSTAEARDFLERRLAELRGRVEQSERALVDYATAREIVTIDAGVGAGGTSGSGAQLRERTLAADSLEQLNGQLIAATGARIEAQAAAGPSGGAKTNATLATLRQQRATAAGEYAELMVQFEPGYPAAQAIEQQIGALDQAIAREERRVGREADEQYQAASEREAALAQRVAALSGKVQEQRRDSIQYNIYQREADTNRQLYDSLLQRYKEIGVAGVSANNIAVIDIAQPPAEPSSPNLILNLMLALGAGALASLALVFLLEQAQEGLSDPTKAADLLGIPLLGSVPKSREDADIISDIGDPKSDIAEAYLSIRSSLAFTTDHGVPRSLMVVSSQPAEGKSTTALALATVLARVGKRVLLIDADLRNPSLHSLLGLDRDTGLSNYLAGENNYAELTQRSASGFDFMPAGPSVPSAAELLSSDRLVSLLREAQGRYDHVVVDSAPIIGLADAPLISRTVEGVVFVVETGGVSVRGLRAALDRLRSAGAPLVGTIMTKFDEKHADYGYGYSYRYAYGARETGEANG